MTRKKQHYIALSGFSGVGKDTVADLLVTHLGFRKVAFADALRGEIAAAFDIDVAFLAQPETKHHPITALAMRRAPLGFLGAVALTIGNEARTPSGHLLDSWLDQPRSPRQILQWWGTDYRRRQHDRYWTRILMKRLVELQRDGVDRFVITDCRFANEADAIHAIGGVIWQVTRPGVDASTTNEGTHISAVDGSAFHPAAVIANNYGVEHLQQLVIDEFMSLETGLPLRQAEGSRACA